MYVCIQLHCASCFSVENVPGNAPQHTTTKYSSCTKRTKEVVCEKIPARTRHPHWVGLSKACWNINQDNRIIKSTVGGHKPAKEIAVACRATLRRSLLDQGTNLGRLIIEVHTIEPVRPLLTVQNKH